MALQKNEITKQNATANYHEIMEFRVYPQRDGSNDKVRVELGVFLDEASYLAGGSPFAVKVYEFQPNGVVNKANLQALIKAYKAEGEETAYYEDAVAI